MLAASAHEAEQYIKPTRLIIAIPIVLFITVLLFFLDYLTGTELSFSIFYLIPVTLAVLLHGRKLGIATAILSSIAWIFADILAGATYSAVYIPVWNTLVRLGYFFLHVVFISSLLESLERVRRISIRDPLTNAANWRYFEEFANTSLKNSRRNRSKITLAYFDVDNFKQVNDTFGHEIGDEILVLLTHTIESELRASDLLARLGGDEFAILLPDTNLESSKEILARVTERVNQLMTEKKWDVTLSGGAMVFSVLPSTIGPMLKSVDDLMYEVKESGKNNMIIVNQYEQESSTATKGE
ncbi:MAG: diguanylate cyclase [Candidatus Hydrogenedentales bacterium]